MNRIVTLEEYKIWFTKNQSLPKAPKFEYERWLWRTQGDYFDKGLISKHCEGNWYISNGYKLPKGAWCDDCFGEKPHIKKGTKVWVPKKK